MKIDPYKHKQKYTHWKSRIKGKIPDLTPENSDLLLRFLNDMEIGINVAKGSVKGARSPIRLNTLRSRMIYLMKAFNQNYSVKLLTNVSEEQLHLLIVLRYNFD